MGYTNRLRYIGGEYDRFSGYTHLGARYYDPTTTKFTQPDTIDRLADPTNGNLYQYAAANPCNNTDPTGRGIGDCARGGTELALGTIATVGGIILEPPSGGLSTVVVVAGVLGVGYSFSDLLHNCFGL